MTLVHSLPLITRGETKVVAESNPELPVTLGRAKRRRAELFLSLKGDQCGESVRRSGDECTIQR